MRIYPEFRIYILSGFGITTNGFYYRSGFWRSLMSKWDLIDNKAVVHVYRGLFYIALP